ncbi:MAG TPA: universal stress protein [Candidatus Caenarcaniphilales bacterium]
MSYQRVLVALDRPPTTPDVFEQALDLAKKERAKLMVFHCVRTVNVVGAIPPVTDPFVETGLSPFGIIDSQQLQLQEEIVQKETELDQKWLQDYCQTAIAQGVPTESECRVGSRSASICDLARDWGADLIVIGRGDINGLKEVLRGSVSNDVMHQAPCSVLVV